MSIPPHKPEPRSKHGASLRFRVVQAYENLPKIVDLVLADNVKSRFGYGYIPFSAEKVRKIAKTAIADDKRHAVMLAEKDGEYHIGTDVLLTTIHNINVSRGISQALSGGRVALGLFRGIETWSRARAVQEIMFHVTSGIDLARAHKLAKRMGFQLIGGSYAKSV